MGYHAAERIYDEVFDMIDREADGSDSLEVCSSLLPDFYLSYYHRVLCFYILSLVVLVLV